MREAGISHCFSDHSGHVFSSMVAGAGTMKGGRERAFVCCCNCLWQQRYDRGGGGGGGISSSLISGRAAKVPEQLHTLSVLLHFSLFF